MAGFKYFLLWPFVFICLSYTFANVVFNSNDGSGSDLRAWPIPDPSAGPGVDRGVSNVGAGPRAEPRAYLRDEGGVSNVGASPRAGPKAGLEGEGGLSNVITGSRSGPKASPGIEGGVSNVGAGLRYGLKAGPGVEEGVSNVGAGLRAGPKAGPGPKVGVSGSGAGPRVGPKGVNSIVNGVEVGVGVGYRPGFGPPGFVPPGFGPRPGYWPVKPYDECTLGYVCPSNECSEFEYGPCESYHFRPLTASTDLHEVGINWANSKPVATTQHGGSGPVNHIDSAH